MTGSFWTKLKKVWWWILLLLAGAFLAYTLIRYPLKSNLTDLTHMDPDSCQIVLWHWGKEVEIADENARKTLLDSLDGELRRRAVGDWIMKTGGGDWVLKLSDGKKEVQLILCPRYSDRPDASNGAAMQPFIKYGHYEYEADRLVSYEKLNELFEDVMSST